MLILLLVERRGDKRQKRRKKRKRSNTKRSTDSPFLSLKRMKAEKADAYIFSGWLLVDMFLRAKRVVRKSVWWLITVKAIKMTCYLKTLRDFILSIECWQLILILILIKPYYFKLSLKTQNNPYFSC